MRRIALSLGLLLTAFLPVPGLLAQDMPGNGEVPPAVAIGILLVVAVISIGFFLVITGAIAYMLKLGLDRVPPAHRKMEPAKAFLIMIPCFNIVWNFMLFPAVSKSYQSYFQSIGKTDVGDCGEKIGFWYAVAVACSIVPILNYLTSIVSLVLLVLFLVKVFELRKLIPEAKAI